MFDCNFIYVNKIDGGVRGFIKPDYDILIVVNILIFGLDLI